MIHGLVILLVGLAGLADVDAPIDATRRAFVELETERSSYFANEPFVVRLRVGVEQGFLRDHVVQLFARHLDVPVQVQAAWLGAFPEVAAPADVARQTFALGEDIVAGTRLQDRIVDGRAFTVLEIERRAVAGAAGALAIPAPRLVLAYATRFDDDLVRGRVALDRRDATIQGEPRALSITPLPEAGKPREFTGAIGRFTIHAAASVPEVDVGQSFTLTVTIAGPGNVAEFAPPAWDGLEGFHVLGVRDRSDGARRTFMLDVAPTRADLDAVPPLAFAYFDPAAVAYATVRSDAIPLTVRARSDTRAPASSASAESTGPAAPKESDASARIAWVASILALAVVVWAAVMMRRRLGRTRAAPSAAEMELRRRAAAALAEFRARIAAEPRALETALVAYFAARLRCAGSAVIAPDLAERLTGSGVAPADARAVARVFEDLVASRYGGAPVGVDANEVTALVERVDAAFSE